MRRHLILAITFLSVEILCGQSLAPLVLNAGGGTGTIAATDGPTVIYYSIGEPVMDDVQNTTKNQRLTQGFLQPDIIGNGVLAIYSYTTAMNCNSSNDASIVLNTSGSNPPFRFKWFKNGVQLSDTTSTLLNLGVGSYSVVVRDKKGSVRSGIWDVTNGAGPCKLIIHNGLSPNNDGYNDFFHIEYISDYPDNTVEIYNRWGDMVWNGKGYNNTSVLWKGDDKNGSSLAAGTYYYVVDVEGKKITGWVELMK